MTWHATSEQLTRYADGAVDAASAASVEAHLLTCAVCRAAVAPAVDPTRLAGIWHRIEDRIDDPRAGVVERTMRVVGVPPHVARLLAATPSLRLSWFGALVAVLAFALSAAHSADEGVRMFLVMAPLLPLAGVAVAYGPAVDPTYEIALAASFSAGRLLLLRSAAVLTCTIAIAGVGAALLPSVGWVAATWLLPALAMAALGLLLATRMDPVLAGSSLAACWLLASVAGFRATGELVVEVTPGAQLCWLVVAVGAAIALYRNRARLEEGRVR